MQTNKLVVITENPPNAGTPLGRLGGDPLDAEYVYLRNNFPPPSSPPDHFEVVDENENKVVAVSNLDALEQIEYDMVLECAGNGRIFMDPTPEGTPWDFGGVSPVVFSGPRLLDVVGPIPADIVELVFSGADSGPVEPEGNVNYQFSLTRDLWDRAILATHLDGARLGLIHGGPVRLIVPGEYAMKSVKWITRIEKSNSPFHGHFVNKYRLFGDTVEPEGTAVGPIAVRSLISWPQTGERIPTGRHEIVGSAWSGSAQVSRVEVSIDDKPWVEANIAPRRGKYAAVSWAMAFDLPPGRHTVVSRAHEAGGTSQPMTPRWNRNGYANNVVHSVEFEVMESGPG